jgi:hypothetical protein
MRLTRDRVVHGTGCPLYGLERRQYLGDGFATPRDLHVQLHSSLLLIEPCSVSAACKEACARSPAHSIQTSQVYIVMAREL